MKKTPASNPRHKVWLHIGMPKTGTTSIQAAMYANRKVLREHGYFYPDFGHRQHLSLARELSRRAGSGIPFPALGNAGPWRRYSELLQQESAQPHTSIISSETFYQRPACLPGLCGPHAEHAFDLLKATIAETAEYFAGCDLTVLAWLRRQDSWLMSMYNETVKTSLYARGFDAYAENSIGTQMHRIMGLWIDAFGRDRVVCRSYDALTSENGNIVDSFVGTVCPDVPRKAFRKTEDSHNQSLSMEALWLKRRINGLLKESKATTDGAVLEKIRGLLADVTATSPEPRALLLGATERKTLMARYLDENRALVMDLGYAELRPLIELDDLADQRVPGEEWKLCEHAIDRMIHAFVLPQNASTEAEEGAHAVARRGRKAP